MFCKSIFLQKVRSCELGSAVSSEILNVSLWEKGRLKVGESRH